MSVLDRNKILSLLHPDIPYPHLFPDQAYLMGYKYDDIFALIDKGANVNSTVTGISILQLFMRESNWDCADIITEKYQATAI